MSLLEMSYCGAILIIAIIVIRAVAINKLPKKTFVILWTIALGRLFIPFDVPSQISIHNLFPDAPSDLIGPVREFSSTFAHSSSSADPSAAAAVSSQAGVYIVPEATGSMNMQAEPQHLPFSSITTVIWLTGMAVVAFCFIVTYVRWMSDFKSALPVNDNSVVRWLRIHPLKRKVRVLESDQISAPLAYGILKPVIIIPRNMKIEDDRQLDYVLSHELTHIKHFDPALKFFTITALCLHWFNPFVWIMAVLLNRDIELNCDEAVIASFGASSRKTYAHMLIDMEEKRSRLFPLASAFSKNAAAERITAIMRFKKVSAAAILTASLIVCTTGLAFATSSKSMNTMSSEALSPSFVQGPKADPLAPQTEAAVEASVEDAAQATDNSGSFSLSYAEYAKKKAEFEARDNALDLEEEKTDALYLSGEIDGKTYESKKAELDRLDDELDLDEDVLDFTYYHASAGTSQSLKFSDYAAKKADIERREDDLDLRKDTLEADYLAGKIDREQYQKQEAELDSMDDALDQEEDMLEQKYGIDD